VTPKSFDIPKTLIWEAYKHVKVNGGAAGIDQRTPSTSRNTSRRRFAAAIDGSGSSVLAATSVEEVRKRRKAAIHRDQLLIVEAALPSRDSSTNPEVLPGLGADQIDRTRTEGAGVKVVSLNIEQLPSCSRSTRLIIGIKCRPGRNGN
jgi:hypothetical protein